MGNPINESGQNYEALVEPAIKRAGIHAVPRKRLAIIKSHIPGKKYVVPDYYIPTGQLVNHKDIAISVKGLTTQGSEQDKFLSHIDRDIPSYPCPVILIMLGDGWSEDYIQWAKSKVDDKQLLAVFTSSDELMLWLKRAKDGRFPKKAKKHSPKHDQLKLFDLAP